MSRRFQFSLKWLFVAMALAAILFAGAHYRKRAQIAEISAEVERCKQLLSDHREKAWGDTIQDDDVEPIEDHIERYEARLKSLRGY